MNKKEKAFAEALAGLLEDRTIGTDRIAFLLMEQSLRVFHIWAEEIRPDATEEERFQVFCSVAEKLNQEIFREHQGRVLMAVLEKIFSPPREIIETTAEIDPKAN